MGKISQLPISKRRRAKMDAHNEAQAKYRAKQKKNKIPDREDFGVAALTVVLLMVDAEPARPMQVAMRRGIIAELAHAGFDREAAKKRFDEMVDRIQKEHANRAWRQQYEAELSAPKQAGPEDEIITG